MNISTSTPIGLLPGGLAVSKEELEWTTTELRNALRSIEWDLEDLEDTIYILFILVIPDYKLLVPGARGILIIH